MNDKPELAPDALLLANAIEREGAVKAAAELRRLFELAYKQHSVIYGLRAQERNLRHNNEVLTNALWKACGDDEQVVNDTIASQGVLT